MIFHTAAGADNSGNISLQYPHEDKAVNNFTDITIKAIQIDEYRTQTECIEHKTKGKDGKFRKSKKLMEHNTSWLLYMLEEYGFIKKRIPMK